MLPCLHIWYENHDAEASILGGGGQGATPPPPNENIGGGATYRQLENS